MVHGIDPANFQENRFPFPPIEEKRERELLLPEVRGLALFSDFPFIRGPPFSFDLPLRYNGQEIYTVR